MRGGALAVSALLLAACNRAPAPKPPANEAAPVAVNVVQSTAAGCADRWVVELDPESFANNGADRHFAAARLGLFRDELERAVRGAVNAACAEDALKPVVAMPIRHIEVHSASGADDPTFSGSDDPSALHLEWTFAEHDLTIPSEMELRGGLICWTDPESDACAEREP